MQRYPCLPFLLGRASVGIAGTFERMAQLFRETGEQASIQFQIRDGSDTQYWRLELNASNCIAEPRQAERPDLEVITTSEVWSGIAAGALSPVDAILSGRMRARGDVDLGRRLFLHLRRLDQVVRDDGGVV